MSFMVGFLVGVAVTIVLSLLLLWFAKSLGFTMQLRNDWRRDNGYYSTYRDYANQGSYFGCRNCYYKTSYEARQRAMRSDIYQPKHSADNDLTDDEDLEERYFEGYEDETGYTNEERGE